MALNGLHNGITFIVTRRCPLQCEHCVMESGPEYRDHLTGADMKAWLYEAHQIGVTRASYSGGDPVLMLRDLSEALVYGRELGMINSVFTSAFWAPSVERGVSTLRRLAAVDILGISTSPHHQRFVPLERVANAVVAADEAGVRGVEVQVSSFRRDAVSLEARLRELLPQRLRDVRVRHQSIFAAGRAATAMTIPEGEYLPLASLDMSCPAPALTVEPDGLLRGCCSSLLALKEHNPLILGDLRSERFVDVAGRAARSAHYQTIRSEGLAPIVRMLERDGLGASIPRLAVNACDLCFRLYAQPNVAAHVRERFAE
jgi:hypothetical protein